MSRIRAFWDRAIRVGQGCPARPARASNRRRHLHGRAYETRPLSPRVLEPRRLLDAALPGLLISPWIDSTPGGLNDTVQVGNARGEEIPGQASAAFRETPLPTTPAVGLSSAGSQSQPGLSPAAAANTPPRNVIVIPLGPHAPFAEAAENDTVRAIFSFQDSDFFDQHVVQVDWGDGSPMENRTLPVGQRQGLMSHRYLDDNPTATPWDTNTIRMTVRDNHGGAATGLGEIRIHNVAPSNLQLAPLSSIDENSVARLQLTFEDPGTLDTHQVFIDWGDGNAVETWAVEPGSRALSADHIYADNGLYTIRVQLADDDLGVVVRTLPVDVLNVDPALTLTGVPLVVDEGSRLTIANLGTFTDPGFDNPRGVPPTAETFSYTIDWGDGTVETGQLPVLVAAGSPGVPTTGSLGAASHLYVDNNVDPSHQLIDYTVTVRLSDDDGGFAQRTVAVTVNNVSPTLTAIAGTDIDRLGATTVSGAFVDPGDDTFVVQIDWRDGTVEQVPLGGPTPRDFSVTHHYTGPPNPLNPAADVEIQVRLLDDDQGLDTGMVAVSNTGDGTRPVRIDTTPQVPRLVFPRPAAAIPLLPSNPVSLDNSSGADISAAVGDTKAIGQRYFVLHTISPQGAQGAGFRLPDDALQDLPGLFRKLPDNRYAIFLVRPETGTRRLVLEVNVRNGRVIDPGDDSDGARDRPPTEAAHESVPPAASKFQGREAAPIDSGPPAASSAPATLVPPSSPAAPAGGNGTMGRAESAAAAASVLPALHDSSRLLSSKNGPEFSSQDSLEVAASGMWLVSMGIRASAGNRGSVETRARQPAARLYAGAGIQDTGFQQVCPGKADRLLANATPLRLRRLRRMAR